MVKRRLPLFLVVVSLIALALAAWSAQTRRETGDAKPLPPAAAAVSPKDFVAELQESQLLALSFVFANSNDVAESAAKRLDMLEASLRDKLGTLATADASDKQRRILEQAGESLALFFEAERQTLQLKRGGKDKLAEATLYGSVAPYANELGQILRTLEIEQQREAKR